MKNKFLTSLIASAIIIPFTFSCNKADQTCNIVRDNYKKYLFNTVNVDEYTSKPIHKILDEVETVKVNGVDTYKFKDVDYVEDKLRSSWPATTHLSRALKIAILALDRDSDELRDIAKKLTYHWVYSNYHSINWWLNELGANSTLANLGLFTFDYLGKKGQDALNGKLRESSLKYRPSLITHTGANVFDYIDITCRDAAINNDKEELTIAFDRLKEEITNDKIEGFQKDGSFFQHGRQVQNVSYGKSVMRVAKTLYQFRGTNYKMPEEKMKILSDYVLKGLQASTFKGYTNYTTVSREYSRPNNLDTQANGFGDLAFFIGVDNYPGKEETYNYIESLKKRKNSVNEDTITYFPIAKMIVANIGHDDIHEGVYISYKGSEPNLTNTECVNGENQLGLNLSYGTNTCVMDHGDEYYNIAPIMDYNYMPGTTSMVYHSSNHSDDETLMHYAKEVYGDNLYESRLPRPGLLGEQYIYNDGQQEDVTFMMTKTKHHKRSSYIVTCFTTIDGMVLVGSNISYDHITDPKEGEDYYIQNKTLTTTIDQYITNDLETKEIIENDEFINHEDGNVVYRILKLPDEAITLAKTIDKKLITKDSWKRNNRDYKPNDSTPVGEKNVAKIIVRYPGMSNSYAYAIQPKTSSKRFKLITKGDPLTGIVHAIELPDGKIAAAFYDKNATFEYENKTYSLPESVHYDYGKGAFAIMEK